MLKRNVTPNCINQLIHDNVPSNWRVRFLKISLALISASCVIICDSQIVKPQTSNSLPLQSGDVITASVDLTRPGKTIPWSFSGFSFEYGDILNFTGRTTAINPSFVQLLQNISKFNNGVPVVRIGGNNTDYSWWNPNDLPKLAGIKYNITDKDFSSIEASLSRTGGKLILGMNLAQNQPSMAVELAKASESSFPPGRVLAYEIGNEPDIYAQHYYYTDPANGNRVNVRPSSYNFNLRIPQKTSYVMAKANVLCSWFFSYCFSKAGTTTNNLMG